MKILHSLLLFVFLAATAEAAMHRDELIYEHAGKSYKGMLFYDDAFEGKRPAVVVYPEKWGVNDFALLRAEMLAENGYVALAADLYGEAGNTRKQDEADAWEKSLMTNPADWAAVAVKAIESLSAKVNVDTRKMALLGLGTGVGSALQAGMQGANVLGIAGMHGAMPVMDAASAGKVRGKLLFQMGNADESVPVVEFVRQAETFSAAGVEWELAIYGSAEQSFTNPYADSYGISNMSFNAEAEQKAWERVLAFFESLFEDELNI